MNWWRRLLASDRLDAELDRELRFHFDRQVEDNLRAGMPEEEARRLARLQFGGLDQLKEQCRDARGTRWVNELAADIRFGFRLLANERGLTLVAVIALALGIGVTNTFFTVVNAVCLRGLPIDDAGRVMYVAARDARESDQGLSFPDFTDMREGSRAFSGLAAFVSAPVVVGDEDRASDRAPGAHVSSNTFELLREHPVLGRDFSPEDDRPGAPPVVILGADVWHTRYGADPALIGRTIRVDGRPSIVIGVMREGFKFPDNATVWRPLALMPGVLEQRRDSRSLSVVGRLRDGATMLEATAELNAIASDLSRRFPDTNKGVRTTVIPINDRYNARITDPVWLAFMTAGFLVLLVACANVGNLLLMRATQRSREIAIRVSLGATRLRVLRQLLLESATLAALGGIVGLGLSFLGARLLSLTLTENAPYWVHFTMDARGFAALATVCLGSVFLFGLAPALHLSRTDVNELLQDGGRAGTGGIRARRWTAALVAAEFALTVVLLAAVAVGFRNFQAAQASDLVINPSNLLTMWVSLPADRYPTPERQMELCDGLRERLRGTGVISSTAFASALPFGGAATRTLAIDGRPTLNGPPPNVSTLAIGGRYFETLGVPVLRGRAFNDTDGMPGRENAIVNERFVAMHFPHHDPIGRRIQLTDPDAHAPAPWLTIVGVSPAIRQRPQGLDPDPVVYVPLRQMPRSTVTVVLRHSSDPTSVAAMVRQELRSLDPELPLYRLLTMDRVISESRMNGRLSQALITIVACIALALSVIGLHAVTGHAVAQRAREIGIRMAMGARPGHVVRMVLRRAMAQSCVGLLAGLGCTVLWERLLGDPTQRFRMTDPVVLTMVAVLVGVVAFAACVWPARRASLLDPISTLRTE